MLRKILLVVAVLTLTACATTKPLYNAEGISFTQTLTQEQAENAIVAALKYKRWRVTDVTKDKVFAEIHVRSHFAKIEIDYTTTTFSIRYVDSNNLDYKSTPPKIHRNYNKWISLLENEIVNNAALVAL